MDRSTLPDEARVEARHSHAPLDTAAEPDLGKVVRLAARILDVPIALICLLDGDTHRIEAAFGLENMAQFGGGSTFCDHAIRGHGVMVVPDATADPRFADNPSVTGEHGIRFYAGVPLILAEGLALGTLCVMDRCPHPALPERDAASLTELAGLARDMLVLRHQSRRSKALAAQAALIRRLMTTAAEAPDFQEAIASAADAILEATGGLFCHVWRLAADGERALFVNGAGLGPLGEEAFFDRLRAMVLTPANSKVAAALVQDVQIWSPLSPAPETASRPTASMAIAFGVTIHLATPFGLGAERFVYSVGFAQAPDDQAGIAELLREATTALRPMLRRHQDEADSRIFRRMVETNPNGVLLTEPPFQEPGPRITYANPAFERMTGYSLAEIEGRSARFLYGPDTDPQSRRRIGEEIAAGRGLTEEMLFYRKDGTTFWTSIRIAPVTDSSGAVTHYFSVQADITLARQARLERQALTRDLQALITAIPGVLMRHRLRDDGKWTRSFIAPGVEALTGFTVEEAYGFGWWVENINEADKQPLYLKLRQANEGGETQADFRFRRKDGAWIWIRILLRGHVGPDGAREVIGIWSDVSEEYRLRLDGERLTADLQRVIATMPGVLIRIRKNADGRWVRPFISPAIEALTGFTVEEAHEIDWWRNGLDPRDRDRMMAMLYQGDLSKPSATDFRFRHKQGHTIWIRRNTAGFLGLDGQPEAITIWNDITAEKRLLLDQEAMTNDLQAVIQAMPGVLMRSRLREDQTWLRYFIAPGIEAMTGYTPAEAHELGWVRRLTHPDDLAAMNASLEAATTEAFSVLDFRFRHKSGHYIWVNRRTRNYWNAAGELELVAIWTDMSVERQLLAERGALALDLEKVIEAVPGALIRTRTDEHGRWHRTYVAPGIKLVTGHTPEEVLEPDWFRANLHPADHGLLNRNMLQIFSTEQSNDEFRFRHKQGHWVWIRRTMRGHYGTQGRPENIIVLHDVTREKLLAEQVAHSSKLAQLGELATGMAHELNQPLAGISLAAENAQRSLAHLAEPPQRAQEKLSLIVDLAKRASDIIDHMRIFGRRDVDKQEPIALAKTVAAAEHLLAPRMRGAGIRFTTDIPEKLPLVIGAAVPLEQVLMNLIGNACDAYASQAEQAPPESRDISVTIREERGWIVIEVQDRAGGIPEEVLPRIFEPFFTTKPVGKGTGLGLSISYGIIKDMGGSISAENHAGGCLMRILLPTAN